MREFSAIERDTKEVYCYSCLGVANDGGVFPRPPGWEPAVCVCCNIPVWKRGEPAAEPKEYLQ